MTGERLPTDCLAFSSSKEFWPQFKHLIVSSAAQEGRGALDRVLEADALHGDAVWERAGEARRHHRIEQDEDAAVVGAPYQPAESLLEAQPRQHVVIARAAERRAPRLVQDGRPRPRHAVEDEE